MASFRRSILIFVDRYTLSCADFETVLSIPPKPDTAQALHYDEALRQRDIVVDVLGCSYLELAYAHPSEIAEYNAPSISPSSIEARSGIPLRASLDEPLPTNCRFYNHLGCRRGKKCLFSHAPDTRSIRDDLLVCHLPLSQVK